MLLGSGREQIERCNICCEITVFLRNGSQQKWVLLNDSIDELWYTDPFVRFPGGTSWDRVLVAFGVSGTVCLNSFFDIREGFRNLGCANFYPSDLSRGSTL
jgi:hypothetical protein